MQGPSDMSFGTEVVYSYGLYSYGLYSYGTKHFDSSADQDFCEGELQSQKARYLLDKLCGTKVHSIGTALKVQIFVWVAKYLLYIVMAYV